MNCSKCGAPLVSTDKFCKTCGAAVNFQNQNIGQNVPQDNIGRQSINNFQQPVNSSYNVPNQGINNNGQSSWTNSYNNQPNYNVNNKKGSNNYIIIGGVVAVLALVLVIGGVVMYNSKDNSSNNNSNTNTNNSVNNTQNGSNNSSNNSQQVSTSSYKVKFSGFNFSIPSDLVYEIDGDYLLVGDELGTWATEIGITQGSFAQLSANKGQLQSSLQQSGMNASSAVSKTLNGVEFITSNISSNGQNAILAYAKANSMYIAILVAYNLDNEFDESILQKVAPIFSSVEYIGESNSIESSINIDIDKIAELAK